MLQGVRVQAETATVGCQMKSCRQQALTAPLQTADLKQLLLFSVLLYDRKTLYI